MVTHSVYWGMTEERRSLFKEADRNTQSTLNPRRKVSWFAGRVFNATYGIRNSPNSQTKILGRIMDLQPVMVEGKVAGIQLQFRLCEYGKGGAIQQSVDREVRNLELGPFDTVYRESVTAEVPEAQQEGRPARGDLKIPLGNFENTYSMIHECRDQGSEDRYLKISFVIES